MQLTTEAIWQEFSARLHAYIRKQVHNEQAAEDLVQEVFLRIHAHGAALRDEEKLASWLYGIARNAIADYFRRHRSEPTSPLPEDAADRFAAPEEDPTKANVRALLPCVRAMVGALPAPYREALQLTEYQGLTQQALAARTGLSLSGAKTRVQRARAQLRTLLLACCHLEFDHAGRVIDYLPECACCGAGACADAAPCASEASDSVDACIASAGACNVEGPF